MERKRLLIKALEGFEWMKNSFFVLSDNKPDETKYLTDDISIPKDNKIIVSNQRQDNKVIPLQEEYESHNIKYKLVLKQDKLYEICLYEHVLSSGAWSVDKGVLTLTDAFLKYDFHALVKDENTIISNYLPFEFRGRSLLTIP